MAFALNGAPGAEDRELVRELQSTARGLQQRGNAEEAISCRASIASAAVAGYSRQVACICGGARCLTS